MIDLSKKIGDYLKINQLKLVTAESCTAGLIASIVAETPGSSSWLEAGFIVYTPKAKNNIGVKFETINTYNITSEEVAREMALGALNNSDANLAISTTGVAGPAGGTSDIPVGTVCFSWAFNYNNKIHVYSEKKHFLGERNEIRQQAAQYSLLKIQDYFNQVLKLIP